MTGAKYNITLRQSCVLEKRMSFFLINWKLLFSDRNSFQICNVQEKVDQIYETLYLIYYVPVQKYLATKDAFYFFIFIIINHNFNMNCIQPSRKLIIIIIIIIKFCFTQFLAAKSAFIAQRLDRWSSKPEVGSSILPEGMCRAFILYSSLSDKESSDKCILWRDYLAILTLDMIDILCLVYSHSCSNQIIFNKSLLICIK